MRYSIQHDNITTTASVGKVGPGLSHSPRGMGCHKTTILSAPKRLLTLVMPPECAAVRQVRAFFYHPTFHFQRAIKLLHVTLPA